MSGFQSYVAVGTLGRDPEIRSTSGGKKVASFSLAVDEGFGENRRTEWITITAWNKDAETAEKYLKKGSNIGVVGKLQTRSWDDKETGKKVYKTEVVVSEIRFMDSKGGGGGSTRTAAEPATRQPVTASPRSVVHDDPFGDGTGIESSDIPW